MVTWMAGFCLFKWPRVACKAERLMIARMLSMKRSSYHGSTFIEAIALQPNLVETNFKALAKMVRLNKSSSYPEQATTAACRSYLCQRAKCYPLMHKCCSALTGWFIEEERLQKVEKTTKGKKDAFERTFSGVRSLWNSKGWTFLLKCRWYECPNGESSCAADGPEKMFVLSKVRVTVNRLKQIILTRLNAWPTICPANARTNELFVLSEFVLMRFDCTFKILHEDISDLRWDWWSHGKTVGHVVELAAERKGCIVQEDYRSAAWCWQISESATGGPMIDGSACRIRQTHPIASFSQGRSWTGIWRQHRLGSGSIVASHILSARLAEFSTCSLMILENGERSWARQFAVLKRGWPVYERRSV